MTSRSKYHNKKTEINGIKFDSQKEAKRYLELSYLVKAGEISNLEIHPRFPIVVEGQKICTYIADFRYLVMESDSGNIGERVVEDVKGVRTDIYKLKKKLVWACYGTEIKEV